MSQMYRPFLVGQKVYLRRVERGDLETRYFQWLNDPEVTRYMNQGTFPNSTESMVAYYEDSVDSQTRVNFAIVTREEDRHVGNIALDGIDWVNRTARVGLLIGEKDSWGSGVSAEAMQLLQGYGFDRLNLRKLCAGASVANVAVVILLKKLGWVQEGRLRQEMMRDNQFHDVLMFGLLREEHYARLEDSQQTVVQKPGQDGPK